MEIREQSNGRHLEVSAAEVGPKFDIQGLKWLYEGDLKLPRKLADMFWQLCDYISWDNDRVEKLEVVGYLHGGKPELGKKI